MTNHERNGWWCTARPASQHADIEASAVVSVDGLIMASSLPAGIDGRPRFGHVRCHAQSGERIAGELGRGYLDQCISKVKNGYVVLMSVGEEAVLTVLARREAKLGLVFLDMRRCVEELTKIV